MEPVFEVDIEWKNFKIDLISMNDWMINMFNNYAGNQAGSSLVLYFKSMPRKEDVEAINKYFETLKEEDEMIKLSKPSRLKADKKIEFLSSVKNKILSKNDHELTMVEKKLRDGIELKNDEIDTLKDK